jgi:hypothetical protein
VLAPCRAKETRSYSEADDEVTVAGAKKTSDGSLYVDDGAPRVGGSNAAHARQGNARPGGGDGGPWERE